MANFQRKEQIAEYATNLSMSDSYDIKTPSSLTFGNCTVCGNGRPTWSVNKDSSVPWQYVCLCSKFKYRFPYLLNILASPKNNGKTVTGFCFGTCDAVYTANPSAGKNILEGLYECDNYNPIFVKYSDFEDTSINIIISSNVSWYCGFSSTKKLNTIDFGKMIQFSMQSLDSRLDSYESGGTTFHKVTPDTWIHSSTNTNNG